MPSVTLFATNLYSPSHMEWTLDGQLLVSEYSAGTIKEIPREGGDMRNVRPFAHGLQGPAAILPLEEKKILVAESWGGTVRVVKRRGNVADVEPFATGLSKPYSLIKVTKEDGDHIFVSENLNGREGWVSDITQGGNRRSKYVSDLPARPGHPGLTPLYSWPDEWQKYAAAKCIDTWQDPGDGSKHYLSLGTLGQILDVTDSGGNYMDLIRNNKAFAWDLNRVGGIKTHVKTGDLYVCEPDHGNIIRVDPSIPRNYRFESPVVRGLNYPTCIRFSPDEETMYVCGQGDGVIWKITDFL